MPRSRRFQRPTATHQTCPNGHTAQTERLCFEDGCEYYVRRYTTAPDPDPDPDPDD